jgi:hypothetical protein
MTTKISLGSVDLPDDLPMPRKTGLNQGLNKSYFSDIKLE